MDQETVKSYANYLLEYRSLDQEIVSLLNRFPFTSWSILYGIAKRRNRKLEDWIVQLTEEFGTFRRRRRIISGIHRQKLRYDLLLNIYSRKWAKFNDAFIQAVAYDSYVFTGEIARELYANKEKRARILFLRAVIRVCFLSSLLVYRGKLVKKLQDIGSDLRLGKYDDAYTKGTEFEAKTQLVFLKAIIERGFVAAIPTVITLVAFENGAGLLVAAAFLLATVTLLPYYVFTKIFE